MKWRRLLWLVVVPPIGLAALSITSCSAPNLGIIDGRLTPLPNRPNGVSSLATDPDKKVAPLPLHFELGNARARLKAIVADLPRCTLIEESTDYLRFECVSLIFRFRDDLEFHFLEAQDVIHVRSVARVGYSDMGVNRRRVETIRVRWRREPGSARTK